MLYIGNMFPDAPVYGIGFSLGAGMLTKYLGQLLHLGFPNAHSLTCVIRISCRSGPNSHEDRHCAWMPMGLDAVSHPEDDYTCFRLTQILFSGHIDLQGSLRGCEYFP